MTSSGPRGLGGSGQWRAAAFDTLVAAHTERLCRFVFRFVGSREVAEDLVQEVFLAIWERGHTFDADDPLPYLYKAAKNRAVSYARHAVVQDRFQSAASRDAAAMPAAGAAGSAGAADARLEESELAGAIARAMEQLPEKCRLVFMMSREQGLTHAQIAEVLGLSVKTVESHIWRALTSLRASLAPYLAVFFLALL